ncbi:hypothetical protein EDB82DRAFT_494069 [Fusarium venenatum]|uniref:uncharacterized protein n=1 Tax=Fusarium venenatum TaxID=56646 RepID=UPI001D923D2D|nr:hypothetical protein EDB82DRAFT_494069 [Fusarium venenatum]
MPKPFYFASAPTRLRLRCYTERLATRQIGPNLSVYGLKRKTFYRPISSEQASIMMNEEREISQLAGLDSDGGQYSKNSALNTERSRLEAEIVHLNCLLVAHKDCCGASH